jgi:hypothetical protein
MTIFDSDNLEAIYQYVRNQRPNIDKYPGLLKKIEEFEGWYQTLSWFDKNVVSDDNLNKARRLRNDVNDAMHQKIPDTWVPADAPQTSPDLPPAVPTKYKIGFSVGAGIVAALIAAVGIRLGVKKLLTLDVK